MSRKARLTEKELDLLARAASECPGETAEAVLARYIELEGRPVSLSTVEKKLAKWRRDGTIHPAKATLPTEERPLGLEAPWSLGVSVQPEYGITSEATGDLLAVWNYCLAIGHVFTIREARWVARLRNVPFESKRRIGELFDFAREYALREQICEILKKPLETKDVDAELGIIGRERLVYRALNLVPKRTFPSHPRLAGKDLPYTYLDNSAYMVTIEHIPREVKREVERKDTTTERVREAITYTKNHSPEQDRIYTALLLYLSKGPKWDTLTTEEYLLILSKLDKWVTRVISSRQLLEYVMLDEEGGITPADILGPAFLEVVGYEVNIKTTNKEAQHEGTYNQEVQE